MLIGMSLKCDFDSSQNSLPNQIVLEKEMKFHRADSESYQKSEEKAFRCRLMKFFFGTLVHNQHQPDAAVLCRKKSF